MSHKIGHYGDEDDVRKGILRKCSKGLEKVLFTGGHIADINQ